MAFSNRPLGGSGLHRPLADINVTPLVDVMLVLLIVFMVTAPMLATGLKVDLPQAKASQPVNPKDPIVVSVTSDGSVAVGTEKIDMADLVAALLKMTGGDSTRIIQIRADRAATYGAIVGVIDQLASSGMVHIALISDAKPRGDDRQPQPAATGAASAQ
jgi:biopolymer transport protein ExbD/biopolymer transport protein TolR